MTTPTIKQMRAWQRQLGSMERKADEIAREMQAAGFDKFFVANAGVKLDACISQVAAAIVAAKSEARRQGFASMPPERVAELSRLAVEAKRLKKTV